MSDQTEPLGMCPMCGAEIEPFQLLVEYEKDDGTTGRFAECESCGEVVRPE
ncbi:Zn finger protein, C2C2 type (plasmid) [Halapricum desulfuricans]|uniref:Zn finger protein, C2C2 type n=1 Tax=Halapricum desulfuricans TaxID=2841257 RepID=A0A897NUD2_9EURY|nr:Zn finger protein, C2C2 type [Halapricum desulfuricans]